jgi:predicted metal-dependent hydrolase
MTDSERRRVFKERVYVWARRLDVDVQRTAVYVRPMTRKWASCSAAGNVSFNVEVLDLDGNLQDYVIVHELLHMSVPNHGRLWKVLMRAYLGDWEEGERRLRQLATYGTGQVEASA